MSEAADAQFGVFLIHYMYTFEDEPFYERQFPEWKESLKAWDCLGSKGRPYQDFIEPFLEKHKIRYRNSYEAMLMEKTRDPKQKLWGFYDYHFSPAGHQVMAREVVNFLREGFFDRVETGL